MASAVRNLSRIVGQGITDVLVPLNDPSALTDALERFFEDRGLLLPMGAAGRDRAIMFPFAAVGLRIETAYTKTIAS